MTGEELTCCGDLLAGQPLCGDCPRRQYCGCCGDEIVDPEDDPLWCDGCAGHVSSVGPLEERSWQAMFGEPCPLR